VIDRNLAAAATALMETAEVLEPAALADLVILFNRGVLLAHLAMEMHLVGGEP
jgi:hypothetical protein